MIYELKLHTLVRFDYSMQVSLPVWMIRLIAQNNFEYNMKDHKWYWQRNTIINDGDYVVRIHPKMLELARLQNGEDPRVADPTEAFLQTVFGQIQGTDEKAWADGFGYGIMAADKLSSIQSQDAIIAGKIDQIIAEQYAMIDAKQGTKQ